MNQKRIKYKCKVLFHLLSESFYGPSVTPTYNYLIQPKYSFCIITLHFPSEDVYLIFVSTNIFFLP